jgi:hypothetical protein
MRLRPGTAVALRMLLLPAALYLALFSLFTYPLITQFPTRLFGDMGDGLQNYWNLWWMNKSIVVMHAPFWKTPYLHYPIGTTLLGHTLNPFNGFIAIPMLRFLTLLQAYNVIVIFSFVMGGVTAFWLAYYVTRAYWPSFIGGCVFTFSAFHFAHAEGHMQLVSLEWLPLFALLWYILVQRPRPLIAVGAAVALLAVVLCDYYYMFFSVLLALLMVVWQAIRSRDVFFFMRRGSFVSFVSFVVIALLTSGPLVISMLLLARSETLIGAHDTLEMSLDLLAPFIPGGHWRFASLTEGYWSILPGNIHESSVYLGWSVLGLLVYVWIKRRGLSSFNPGLWFGVLGFFLILAVGPVLHVWGNQIGPAVLPYGWLQTVFPPLEISGVPVRMMAMVTLAAAVIVAMGFKLLMAGSQGKRLVALLLVLLLAVEYVPKPLPASALTVPGYVTVLAGLKDDKGVLDTVANKTMILYYQTVHEKPIVGGYVSRLPKSVADVDFQISATFEQHDYAKLRREFGVRYVVTQPDFELSSPNLPVKLLYQGPEARVYDLGE